MNTENRQQVKGYLDAALDYLGNAIAVLEDVDDDPSAQELRDIRAKVGDILDRLDS